VIDAYDAAVIERRAGGKVKITKKHETPTRVGGVLGGGAGLATEAEVKRAMKQARKIEARHLTADTAAIEADAKSVQV
jgi:hypothetical protein